MQNLRAATPDNSATLSEVTFEDLNGYKVIMVTRINKVVTFVEKYSSATQDLVIKEFLDDYNAIENLAQPETLLRMEIIASSSGELLLVFGCGTRVRKEGNLYKVEEKNNVVQQPERGSSSSSGRSQLSIAA